VGIQTWNYSDNNMHLFTNVLNNFIKNIPKVKLIIEELNTDEIITKLNNGQSWMLLLPHHIRRKIKEIVLYFEPFIYILKIIILLVKRN
jgi:dihydroorotase